MTLDHCTEVENEDVGFHGTPTDRSLCEVSGETPRSKRFLNVYQPLQLGGVKTFPASVHASIHLKGFTGCIRNLQVDSKVYDLEQPMESVNTAAGCAVTDELCSVTGSPPCGGHGFCISEWNSAKCDCHPGYYGEHCDSALQEWTFERGSWVHLVIHRSLSPHSTYVQLMVRTRVSSSTILHLASKDRSSFLRLEVAGGHFAVYFNFGERNYVTRLPDVRIDHGQWTLLSLERYGNVFTLRIDRGGGVREVTSVIGKNRLFEADTSSVLLGNSLPQQSENGFQGCLRDLRINGHWLPLGEEGNEHSSVVSVQGISNGCHTDVCRSLPCPSHLICIDLWRKHECRCPADKVEVMNNVTGQKQCHTSPCTKWSCRNGGTCVVHSQNKYVCQCRRGYKGRACENIHTRTGKSIGLSSGSILAISMCLLIFIALLVSYTVWSQWGRSKFRKGGVYHIPAEHESWEDIRGNVLNYNEEGGGDHEQRWKKADRLSGTVMNNDTKVTNGYDPQKLKKPIRANTHQLCSTSNDPRIPKLCPSPDHFLSVDRARGPVHPEEAGAKTRDPYFQAYISQIILAMDNDKKSHPPDALHTYSTEGDGSVAGSLSSLYSSCADEDFSYEYLCEWGSKFDRLRDLYQTSDLQA